MLELELAFKQEILKQKKFEEYKGLLQEYNSRLNLVSSRDLQVLESKHFLDSLAPLFLGLIPQERLKVLDVGSGGGFPGIPLKIMRSDLEMYLLEQSRKKASFLEMVVSQLELEDTTVWQGEAKEYLKSQSKSFDVVVSRAVGELKKMSKITLPFLNVGGRAILYKGKNVVEELREIEESLEKSYQLDIQVYPYKLNPQEEGRNILVLRKL